MKFLLPIALIVAVLLVYALWLRDWLKAKPGFARFFEWVEPIELALFRKSPTILFARLKMLSGVVLMGLTQLGTINLEPIMPLVPDKYEGFVRVAFNLLPLVISAMGMMDEKLRNATTLPIELVAVKEATAPVEVKVAIAQAVEAKEQAVAVVKAA